MRNDEFNTLSRSIDRIWIAIILLFAVHFVTKIQLVNKIEAVAKSVHSTAEVSP